MGCNQQRSVTTVQELEADLGIPKTTVSEILMQGLGMKSVMAKFIPQLLLPDQKERRAAVVNNLIQTTTSEPGFLRKVTSSDESWVYLWLSSENEGPVIPMEVAWFSLSEEGAANSQQDQDHVNCVF